MNAGKHLKDGFNMLLKQLGGCLAIFTFLDMLHLNY